MGSNQWYQSLLNFYQMHPELKNSPLVLAGESYAGTYLPLLAANIVDNDRKSKAAGINLVGMVLGDAWVNPDVQMKHDTLYAWSHGMISNLQKEYLDKEYADKMTKLA